MYARIRQFLQKDIVRKTGYLVVLSVIVKLISLGKEVVVSSKLGLNTELDNFYIAYIFPAFFYNVFLTTFSNIFVPNYITARHQGKLHRFESTAYASLLFFIMVIIVILYFFRGMIIGMVVDDPVKYIQVERNYVILLPSLLFTGLNSMITGILNANKSFTVPIITPIITTVVTLLFFLVKGIPVDMDIMLSISILVGSALEFVFMLLVLLGKKIVRLQALDFRDRNFMMYLKQLPSKMTSSFLSGCNTFVDQSFASVLSTGAISSLNYSTKIPSFISGISINTLGSILLPYFSEINISKSADLRKKLYQSLVYSFVICLIISIGTMLFSHIIVKLLFERGKFSHENTLMVANLQMIACIQIPFYVMAIILVKFLTAINKNKFAAYASIANLIVNITADYILMKYFGVYGLAMATTVMVVINFMVLFYFSKLSLKLLNQ